ncbi:hypothetical protein E2562_009856 [Oryza meyeriana var. granulata]|uniref:Uncharacterized protein n=1 Tax=Oryza meyeriana var. granulata TaxID=110450 RepID=A0A6G1BUJ7_9ORYZ|nr:hypothetical protein E2562_009856 [Oryza meyeriana var. granulata]
MPAVVGAPTAGTPVGSSGLAGTLRAATVLLRLDLSANASDAERRDLAAWVAAATPAVVGAPTAGTPIGSSGLAGMLRAAAVLLRLDLSADASNAERRDLAAWVAVATPAVVGTPTAGTPVGSSGLAGKLRAAAVLLRLHLSVICCQVIQE